MATRSRTTLRVGAILFFLLGSTVPAGPPDAPLFLHPAFGTGAGSEAIFAAGADFDDDGHLDLVVGSLEAPWFTVALGRGNGLFDTSEVSSGDPATFPMYPAIADLDSDGIEDLAMVRFSQTGVDREVGIHLGNGDGTFADPVYYHVGDYAGYGNYAAPGDFNEDGHLDLLLPGRLLLNQGDGTFPGPIATPGGQHWSLAMADFNGDDKQDYATLEDVYLGDGTGSFAYSAALPSGTDARWVTAGDLNGDDRPDVVVVFESDNEMAVVFGNGDGTFGTEQRYAVGNRPRYVRIDDIDKDGLPDIAVVNNQDWSLSLFYGSGGGSLEPAVEVEGFLASPYSLVIGDFDSDGLNDLAVPSRSPGDLRLALADGPRSFPTKPSFGTGSSSYQSAVVAGDVNADGRADLAVANEDSDDISVLVGNGAGTFAPEIRIAVGLEPSALVFAQLTSDSDLDLAVTNSGSNDVSVLAGNGDGTFTALTPVAAGSAPSSIAAGDLNDDGKLDLAVTSEGNNTVTVLLGNGDGTFGVVFPPTIVGIEPRDLALEDFDGDTRLDLVVASYGSGDIRVYIGNGNGTFTPAPLPYIYPLGAPARSVEVADLDGDGRLDLAAAGSARTQVYLGNGDATFAAGASEDLPGGGAIFATDLDGDGILDLLGGTAWRYNLLLGNGDGTFGGESEYSNCDAYYPGAPGDFDLDGRVDLAGDGDATVRIALNQTGPKALGFLADGVTLAWPSVLGAQRYDVYRGNLSALVDTDDDGLPDDGYGACVSGLDGDTRDTFFVDAELPTSGGEGFFYLRSSIDAMGDSGLGTNSAGQARLPETACP